MRAILGPVLGVALVAALAALALFAVFGWLLR
jgi:hypothetical protein